MSLCTEIIYRDKHKISAVQVLLYPETCIKEKSLSFFSSPFLEHIFRSRQYGASSPVKHRYTMEI